MASEPNRSIGVDAAGTGPDWPRRLVGAVLLVWLSPAIALVLLIGGAGIAIGTVVRLAGRLAGVPGHDGNGVQGTVAALAHRPHWGAVEARARGIRRG